jgi:hypothetical protein
MIERFDKMAVVRNNFNLGTNTTALLFRGVSRLP